MTPAHRVPLEGEAPAEPCSRALLTGKGSAEVHLVTHFHCSVDLLLSKVHQEFARR